MTETLVRFAAPVLGSGGAPSSTEDLKTMLGLAGTAWNDEVVREVTGSEEALAESRERFQGMPEPIGPHLLELLDRLVARKRAEFAGDLRGVGRIDLRSVGGAETVSVQELHPEDLLSRRQRGYRTKHAFIDMQTYLPEDGLMKSLVKDDRPRAHSFGAIAAEGSLAAAGHWVQSSMECGERTPEGRCTGRALLRRIALDDRIDWECPACGDSMAIHGWRGTPWDLSGREELLAALPAGERMQFSLSDAERRALQRSNGLHVNAVRALAAARRGERGWLVDASREEVEDLAVAAAAGLAKGARVKKPIQYTRIAERLHRALGRSESIREAAETANILSFRARDKRSGIRGVPRIEASGAHRLSVVLAEVEPPVRRGLEVRSDTTLEELHAILQVAFGWSESHQHAFRAGETLYLRASQRQDAKSSPTHRATLIDIAPRAGDVLVYEYDLGAGWQHRIEVVEALAAASPAEIPRCSSGEGAAPPEGVGGPGGYADFQAALADPDHPDHETYRDRLAGPFDPNAFDLEATNRLLRQLGRWQA
jgi:hypothetical protein